MRNSRKQIKEGDEVGKLNNKVAIVTGGGTGIGRTIALGFAAEGADVVICSRNIANLDKVSGEIESLGRRSLAIAADISDKQQIVVMVKQTVDTFGQIDILVNNAGIAHVINLLDTSEEIWDEIINTNLKGTFLCIQAVAGHMIKKKYGKIINISSVAGRGSGLDNGVSYCASKAGVIQVTQNAAFELGPYGINVNCIAPGLTVTPMVRNAMRTEEEFEVFLEGRKSAAVLGRLGEPEDIANAAVFLASDDSSFISGQTVPVDGGRTDRM